MSYLSQIDPFSASKQVIMCHSSSVKSCQPCQSQQCAICFSPGTSLNPIVSPCACKNRQVHLHCLQNWNVNRPEKATMCQCEVCLEPYWGGKNVHFAIMVGVWLVESGRRFVGLA